MFQKTDINLDNPQEARQFLQRHCKYYTLNPWSQTKSYANNVRVTKLDLTRQQLDVALDMVCDETLDAHDYEIEQQVAISDFCQENHVDVYFNGRSGGWLVMVPKDAGGRSMFTGFDDESDIEDDDNAIELAKLVHEFDGLCDNLRDNLIRYAQSGHIETEDITYTVTKTIRRLVIDE